MAKFCTKCGAQLNDDAGFCTKCGAPQAVSAPTPAVNTQPTPVPTQSTAAVKKSEFNKNTVIGISAVAIVVLIIVGVFIAVFSGGYKTPIKNMLKGIQNADAKTYMKALPDYKFDDTDDSLEFYQNMIKEKHDSLENKYGKNLKISYDIVQKEKLTESVLNDNYGLFKDSDIKISKGYSLKLNIEVKGDSGSSVKSYIFNVAKVNGDWIVLYNNFYDFS